MSIQFPRILRPLLGKDLTWRVRTSSKVIYLTFDDGPVPEVTPTLLDMLDEYRIKATFFCVGENVERYPELYNDILKRGHRTGNHTYNHLKGFSTKNKDYITNINKAAKQIDSRLFRPPHGQITPKQIDVLKSTYKIIMWDIITHDYNQFLSPDEVLRNVTCRSRNGSIVVFHDSLKAKTNMLNALPRAIEFWNSNGYQYGLL